MNLRDYNDKVGELLERYDAAPKCSCTDKTCVKCNIYKEIMEAAGTYLRPKQTSKSRRPKYVTLNGLALKREGSSRYYRYAGGWEVGSKVVDGKIFSISEGHVNLDGVELIETTEEEWRKDNEGYIG